MKRIFQRRVRSPSASSSSESATAAASPNLSPRRAASASTKASTARNGAEPAEKRVTVGSDALHAKVAAFATSVREDERQQALIFLRDALVNSSDDNKLLNEREANTLVSVSAQRLRGSFSRALELFNGGRLDGNADATFLLAAESEERNQVLQLLQILKVLLVKGDKAQALLLVGERIPSTFVKVVKALSGADAAGAGELVELMLDVLAVLVTSPEAVQELNESSTLHRIFHLAFQEQRQQMSVVKVVEALVQSLQPNRWRSMVKQLYEERCLLDLIHNANGTGVLAKAVLVTALSLRSATVVGLSDLHRQMHTDRQRHKILAMFIQMFESRQRAIGKEDVASASLASFRQDDQDLADAVAELCLSGNESPLPRSDIHQNKAFRLAFDATPSVVGQSLFNAEAFGLLSDILTYLHGKTKFEEEHKSEDHVCEVLRGDRERLECHFLEKLCQIVVTYRFDYEFVSKSNVITRIIEQLDDYSEMAQHTVLSVLSAIAIEAKVIPFTELAAINAFIRKDTFQRRSIHALLAFGANLLRFDDAYHEVFRSVGLEQYFERTLCGLPMLECVCELIGNISFQPEGLTLWGSIVRLSLDLHRGDEVLRNVVNSLLQAIRYVTLAVYFPEDGEVTLAFPGNLAVLQGALAYLESLVCSNNSSVASSLQYGARRSEQSFSLCEAPERGRVFDALLDCDIILSLLGTLCAVAKKWEVTAGAINDVDDGNARSAMVLSLQSIFSLVTTNKEAERQFLSSISFGTFGDLIAYESLGWRARYEFYTTTDGRPHTYFDIPRELISPGVC
ncbi:hypothetical protein PRIC1_013064 [Phytophthora ramorum]